MSKCSLPTAWGNGIQSGIGKDSCKVGGSLAPKSSCNVQCQPGYKGTGSGTYSCNRNATDSASVVSKADLVCKEKKCSPIPSFNPHIIGANLNPCKAGTVLESGGSCNVQCSTGYKKLNGNESYSCTKGALQPALLQCGQINCPMPKSFVDGIEGSSSNGCVADSSLAAGDSCNVQCSTGYKKWNGDGVYTCDNAGDLLKPTLSCRQISCKLPAIFGANIIQGDVEPCTPWSPLMGGDSCSIKCSKGFFKKSGSEEYSCSKKGVLTGGDLQCGEPAPRKKKHGPKITSHRRENIRQDIDMACNGAVEQDVKVELNTDEPIGAKSIFSLFGKSQGLKPATTRISKFWS